MFSASTFTQQLINTGIGNPQNIIGCTDKEIQTLEQRLGHPLPTAYKAFLRAVGHSAGGFWNDVDYSVEKLEWIDQYVHELLFDLDDAQLVLPRNSFVFSMRRGEQFLFFLLDDSSQDPPIYRFCVGDTSFVRVSDTFSEVIEGELVSLQAIRSQIPPGLFPWA